MTHANHKQKKGQNNISFEGAKGKKIPWLVENLKKSDDFLSIPVFKGLFPFKNHA